MNTFRSLLEYVYGQRPYFDKFVKLRNIITSMLTLEEAESILQQANRSLFEDAVLIRISCKHRIRQAAAQARIDYLLHSSPNSDIDSSDQYI